MNVINILSSLEMCNLRSNKNVRKYNSVDEQSDNEHYQKSDDIYKLQMDVVSQQEIKKQAWLFINYNGICKRQYRYTYQLI